MHVKIRIICYINPRPISALGISALWLILVTQVDTACDMDFAMYYSLTNSSSPSFYDSSSHSNIITNIV